ncbi:hypothetical protein Tco_1312564 [Tanacetum coccineum]
MSTSKTYQQSLADAGFCDTMAHLLKGLVLYTVGQSRFRRYINQKRENQKWLNKAFDEGPYQFEMFIPNNSKVPKLQTAEDLQGDALLHYDAEMELMNLILLSIPNDIYNSVDACTLAKDMWKRKEEDRRIAEDQAAKDRYWKIPICYDDDEDYTIAITPVLSIEEPIDSLIMEDEHLDAIPATKIGRRIDSVYSSNNQRLYLEKLSKINLLIAKIEAINSNPPPSSDVVTKSPSTFLNFFLEETNTFDNSIPESETFCFDLEENSSGSTTTHSDYSLLNYEAFYFDDDHIEEKSSGNTTTMIRLSLIFRMIRFLLPIGPDPGELTSIVDSVIRENVSFTTNVNLPFEDDQSPLLAYVVWIFLPFLTYPVTPP